MNFDFFVEKKLPLILEVRRENTQIVFYRENTHMPKKMPASMKRKCHYLPLVASHSIYTKFLTQKTHEIFIEIDTFHLINIIEWFTSFELMAWAFAVFSINLLCVNREWLKKIASHYIHKLSVIACLFFLGIRNLHIENIKPIIYCLCLLGKKNCDYWHYQVLSRNWHLPCNNVN